MRDRDSGRSNAVNQAFGNILVSLATCARAAGEMAGQSDIGVSSEVYSWLSSISNGLNLQRLAPEFERRGFRSKHSLKYMNENDLEIIINSPDKLLLAERRILEKELQELKKPSLQPKELFPPSSPGPLQFVSGNSTLLVGPSSSVSVQSIEGPATEGKSREKTTDHSSYLERKSAELTENLSLLQTQITSASDQLQSVRREYEEASSKANGRRGKLCGRCHLAGHYKGRCSNAPCTDMNKCGASEKHPESKSEIQELQKLIRDLEKKEAKAADELRSFKLAKERSSNNFFAIMRPRLRKQNEGRYVDRFALDKDLIILRNIFNNKVPLDDSKDWQMPFLIEQYRRNLPCLNVGM